jgi:SAM-dependent methyltransferase
MPNAPAPPLEFDLPHYRAIDAAREVWLRRVLDALPFRRELRTALDVGCGAGHFCGVLAGLGFAVTGADLRDENLTVCRERHPGLTFTRADLDGDFDLGTHDLVLMFGVLYHLQSPLTAVARLARSVGRVGVVSTRVAAGDEPALYLFRENEGPAHNTARLTAVPTLPALLTLFREAGLDHAYLPADQPDHPEWKLSGHGRRVSFVVARESLMDPRWRPLSGPPPLRKWESREGGVMARFKAWLRRGTEARS